MSAPDAGLSRQAAQLFRAGRLAEAEALLRKLVETESGDWQHALLLGLCRQARDDLDDARHWLERAVELGDGQPTTHYYLGRLHAAAGRITEAREQFAQAIAIDPNHVDARTEMALLALDRGDAARAISELRVALRANEAHVPALAGLARALLAQGELNEAESRAALAVRLAPANAAAQAVMGRVFVLKGNEDFAERCFHNALDVEPAQHDANLGLARLLSARGELDPALAHYHRALGRGPVTPMLLLEIAAVLARFGDVAQARNLLVQGQQRFPGDPALAAGLAELMLSMDDIDAAAAALASLPADRIEAVWPRARVLRATGRSSEALELIEAALDGEEAAPVLRARLQLELADLRSELVPDQPQHARAAIASRLDREAPDFEALLTWSMVCERAGQLGAAISALARLLERDPLAPAERALVHGRLAHCQDRADRRDQAWSHWQQARRGASPHRTRLAQGERELQQQWLTIDSHGVGPVAADDAIVPLLVGGWAGSGREIVLAALRHHHQVVTLDPARAAARLEALGGPAEPGLACAWSEDERRLARRRFLRGQAAPGPDEVVLEPGWWPAGSLATLLEAFPRVRMIHPDIGWNDMILQWQIHGFDDIEALIDAWREQRGLLDWLRQSGRIGWVELERDRLATEPQRALAELFSALGLTLDEAAIEAGVRFAKAHPLVLPGAGARYSEVIATAFGSEVDR